MGWGGMAWIYRINGMGIPAGVGMTVGVGMAWMYRIKGMGIPAGAGITVKKPE